MMLNFSEGGHPVFEDPVLLKEQRKKKIVFSFQWQRRNRRSDSSYSYFRQSAQHQRSSGGYVWRTSLGSIQTLKGYGETRRA